MKQKDATFALMFEFKRLILSRMRNYPCPSLPQLEVLHFVAENSTPTMRELAAHLKITAPSATALADELVRAKLIARTKSAEDRRRVTLSLTAQGKRELRASMARREKIINQVLSPLSSKDRDEFNRLLQVIVSTNR